MELKSYLLLILFVWIVRAQSFDVRKQCRFTRYPKTCLQTLSELRLQGLQRSGSDVGLLSGLVENLRNKTVLVASLSSNSSSQSYKLQSRQGAHAASSAEYCAELMSMSVRRLDQSLSALKESPSKRKGDIQTWLSAVLTFQFSCRDHLSTDQSDEVVLAVSKKIEYLSNLASNTLALVNRITAEPKNTTTPPLTDFPQWVNKKNRRLLQSRSVKANAVVAKDGSGHYTTVSDAIRAATGQRFVIYVKAGVYKEKIRTSKDGITLIGDGKYSTIITYSANAQSGLSTPDTATFTIIGDGFIARDIGFQNTAGPKAGQAVALNIVSDRAVLYRCSIAGYQDTLLANALRQFYRECDIYGTIDFIFGNAAAVFQSCYIVLRRPQFGSYNVILANARADPGQTTGFSIQRCRIIPSSEFSAVKQSVPSYLGRPWKQYSRAVIMQSIIDNAVHPRGWVEWEGSFALKTLYFAEYSNSGPGASTSKRVQWSGYHVISGSEADKFTVAKFIGGTSWLPSTGINFDSGLS